MSSWYLVSVTVQLPYPKQFTYRQQASSFGPAVNRSLRQFRSELGRKVVTSLDIKVTRLKASVITTDLGVVEVVENQ